MDLNRVRQIDDVITPRNALISVTDKHDLDSFLSELWEIIPSLEVYSSGGTYRELQLVANELGRTEQLHEIADLTGQPEMQGGLVKTLDYKIYLGLLSETYNTEHQSDIQRTGAVTFDLTVCNFYPFEQAAEEKDATIEDLRTHVDIGGPAMLRASAKNFLRVAAIHSPDQYSDYLGEIRQHGGTTLSFRADLAAAAFRYTSRYENTIAGILGSYVQHGRWQGVYETRKSEESS